MAAEITAEIEQLGPNPLRDNGSAVKEIESEKEKVLTEQVGDESSD